MKTAEEYIKGICEFNGVPPFREKMVFFYDETGNCRKFTLKDGVVNAPEAIDYDFILGGIAFNWLLTTSANDITLFVIEIPADTKGIKI